MNWDWQPWQIDLAHRTIRDQQYLHLWYLYGPDGEAMALEYCLLLLFNSWFVNVFAWEYTLDGLRGLLVAWSCGRSTTRQEAIRRMPIGQVDPHWVEYDLYFHPDAFLCDLEGMHPDPRFYRGTLGEHLAEVCPNWRLNHRQELGQLYFQSLREILSEGLGVPSWLEVFAGRSTLAYQSLDVYWKVQPSHHVDVCARWLLNSQYPPARRWHLRPDEWVTCLDWVPAGSHDSYFDWVLEQEPVVPDLLALRAVSFRPLDGEILNAIRAGFLLLQPGMALPFLTDDDDAAIEYLKGKGKGRGRGRRMLALPRL